MKIEKYLVLNKYLLSLLGISDFKTLQEKFKDAPTGLDTEGRTHFINILRSSFSNIKIDEDDLLNYDNNIRFYVQKINSNRTEKIELKYFQYISILFTEIFFDKVKNNRYNFLKNINEFIYRYQQNENLRLNLQLSENDLSKIAYWMATGSGKTLIMHINYYQFIKYKLFKPENIILITPNEGLSKQHYDELIKSGIPAHLYQGSLNGGLKDENEVLVIEMTKFVEEKKGGGTSLPVEAFEGKNLIFVDEGHKGKKSEEQKWAKLRNKLSQDGFVFEYSATFGQILSENNVEILNEYSKSIIFDYSYKYFYLDGYGKDFSILNIKERISSEKFFEYMFIANLLSFYEQLLIYEKNKRFILKYNIEKPLWIFVGSTVTGEKIASDIVKIISLFYKIFNDKNWLEIIIKKILNNEIKIINNETGLLFKDKFNYLKNNLHLNDLLNVVFYGNGNIKFYEIKNSDGEIGMKLGDNPYFGVINVGNVSKLKENLSYLGIELEQDVIATSLFENIKSLNSKINILIGAKKFIEGWDTWRVSSMGLLNIGRSEGPQIIQLFGRGVRLKGENFSLKRSFDNPEVKKLQTLNIFGMKSDYLDSFLQAISNEEVEYEELNVPLQLNFQKEWNKLKIPYLKKDIEKNFIEKQVVALRNDSNINFTIDLTPKIQLTHTTENRDGIVQQASKINGESGKNKFNEFKGLIDLEKIYCELLEYKIEKGFTNLVFDKSVLLEILSNANYDFYVFPGYFDIKSATDLEKLNQLYLIILKKYIQIFFNRYKLKLEKSMVNYESVREDILPKFNKIEESGNAQYYYTIKIDKKAVKQDVIKKLKKLIKNFDKLIKEENDNLPRVNIYNSLYIPLLIKTKNINIQPDYLVESEVEFIKGIREYFWNNQDKIKKNEIYLLRNNLHSGVGFQLTLSKYYPDFIMWVKKGTKMLIAFIDPKGLEHTHLLDDEKVKFSETIKEIEVKLNKPGLVLESFIISATKYVDLIKGHSNPPSKDNLFASNVLFFEDENWAEQLFNKIFSNL